jgi:hypothetical protein
VFVELQPPTSKHTAITTAKAALRFGDIGVATIVLPKLTFKATILSVLGRFLEARRIAIHV